MLKETSRGITFCPSSNNTPSSTPSSVGSKRKVVPKEKYNEELPSGIGDDSSYSPLVIDDDVKMIEVSGGNCYMNNHTLFQHYLYYNNGDVSSGYAFINRHTLYQCDDSSTFKDMDGGVENFDVSSGYGSMNNHTIYQHNGSK